MEAIVERSGNFESYGAMVETDWPINGWNTQHRPKSLIPNMYPKFKRAWKHKKKTPFWKKSWSPWFLKKASLFLGDSVAAKTGGGSQIPMDFCRSIFAFFRSTWQYSSATDVGAATQKWSPAGRSRKFTGVFFWSANGPSGKPWKWGVFWPTFWPPSSKRSLKWRFQMVWLEQNTYYVGII